MGDFRGVSEFQRPRKVAELTPEAANYKSFKALDKKQQSGRVAALAYCPAPPYRLAVVSGTRVSFWKRNNDGTFVEDGHFSKCKDLAQCVAWRNDGKLLLIGEASGSCAVVEPVGKQALRRFMGHGDAVTCAAFSAAERSQAATGCRDGRLRIWDITTGSHLHTVDAATDCLKVVAAAIGGAWLTAGYDGHVRLWEVRVAPGGTAAAADAPPVLADATTPGEDGVAGHQTDDAGAAANSASVVCVTDADHGHPIEAGVAFPGGAMYATVGGTAIKVWDLSAGGKLVQELPDAHSKAVMSVCLDNSASILLTASFDGLAKVYQAADLRHIWTYKLPAPATCCAWRPDDRAFVLGFETGEWQLRQRRSLEDVLQEQDKQRYLEQKKRPRVMQEGHLRGQSAKPGSDDEVVEPDNRLEKRKRESTLDHCFRKFEYRKAIEFIVHSSTPPAVGLGGVDELMQRGALATALSELGEDMCAAVLRWLGRVFNSMDPLQHQIFLEAFYTLLDRNVCLKPPSTALLLKEVQALENKVSQEVKIVEALRQTSGILRAVAGI